MNEGKLVILAGGISSRMKKPVIDNETIDSRLLKDSDEKSKSMIGVGDNYRPFLDYLLYNARESGYREILIVVGEKDESIWQYYGKKEKGNEIFGMNISYAVQKIPVGREKPLGTADALYQGLATVPEWAGKRFTVCNSDNLYSKKALKLLSEDAYPNMMIDYNRSFLDFEEERISKFAVTKKNKDGFLIDIIEKPTIEEIESVQTGSGYIGVSMNIFRFQYNLIFPILESVPFHPVRQEKELPEAVKSLAGSIKDSVYALPLAEHVPDLTNKNDILPVKQYLEKHFPNFSL